MFLGGLFNISLIGIPLYVYCWIGTLGLAGVLYWALKVSWWDSMEPFHGLYAAGRGKNNVSLISGKFHNMELVDESVGKCILGENDFEADASLGRWNEIPETWFQALERKITGRSRIIQFVEKLEACPLERRANIILQKQRCDIIQDSDDWTLSGSRQHESIVRSIMTYNELNPDDKILSYQKLLKRISENKIPVPEGVQLTETIPWSRIDAAFPPMGLTEGDFSGKKRELVELIMSKQRTDTMRLAMYALMGGLGFAALVLVFRLIIRLVA